MADDTQVAQAPFVGRRAEQELVERLLTGRDGAWRVWFTADAGEGKSRLLQTILERHGGSAADILDFFIDGLRTRPGVLIGLAERYGLDKEPAFAKAVATFQDAARPEDDAARRQALERMETALVEGLNKRFVGDRRGIIALDTVELISPLQLNEWLFTKFLPRLKKEALVIACGRSEPVNRVLETPGDDGQTQRLGELSRDDVAEYVGALASLYATPERIDHIYAITRGKGQALLLGLLVEKLADRPPFGQRLQWREVEALDNEGLRQELVDAPLADPDSLGQVLLYLTHAYHGLDADMLAHLMTPETLGSVDYVDYLRSLRPYAFIKYHEDPDDPARSVVRLHDYFRERSLEQLADRDKRLSMRRRVSSQLAGYFAAQLAGEAEAVSPRRDRLTQQYFYHLLFANPNSARVYGDLWDLFDRLWHEGRYDYMDVLLTMVRHVVGILQEAGDPEPILENLEKAARAWMGLEVYGEPTEVIRLADEILATKGIPQRLKLTALVAKGTVVGRGVPELNTQASDEKGPVERAAAMLEEARRGYEELLAKLGAVEAGDAAAQQIVAAEAGLATVHGIRPERYLILNTIGYLYRNRGDYQKAKEAYQESYDLSHEEGDLYWEASAATHLGTVSRYLGQMGEAFDWLSIGLNNRREMGIPDQIAFGLAAMARLERDHFDLSEARNSFIEARDIWAGLDAARDYTTMLFELGWVDVLLDNFNAADDQFKVADQAVVEKGLNVLLPDLREKQGKSLLRRARQTTDATERRALLDQAEPLLLEGLKVGREREQNIYVVNCLAALCRLAAMKGEFERIAPWEAELRAFSDHDYEFKPAYADLEEVLGDVAMRRAGDPGSPDFDLALFDEATDHYLQQLLHLGRFSDHLYHRGLKSLRAGLLEMPPGLRRRAGERLLAGWRAKPDVAVRHDGFIRTVKNMAGL